MQTAAIHCPVEPALYDAVGHTPVCIGSLAKQLGHSHNFAPAQIEQAARSLVARGDLEHVKAPNFRGDGLQCLIQPDAPAENKVVAGGQVQIGNP